MVFLEAGLILVCFQGFAIQSHDKQLSSNHFHVVASLMLRWWLFHLHNKIPNFPIRQFHDLSNSDPCSNTSCLQLFLIILMLEESWEMIKKIYLSSCYYLIYIYLFYLILIILFFAIKSSEAIIKQFQTVQIGIISIRIAFVQVLVSTQWYGYL